MAIAKRTQRPLRNSVGAVLGDSPPYVTLIVLGLNLAAYLATALPSAHGLNHPEDSRLFTDWQLLPYFVGRNHEYFRLLTAAFLHANLLHIAVNMLSLVFVGPYLEHAIGRWRFGLLYLVSALGGSAAVYAFGSPLVAVVGASGALFGLLGACLVLVRRLNLDLQYLVGIVVVNFALTFSVAGISRLGHIGGFVTGALGGLAIGGWPTLRQRLPDRVQLAGFAGLFVLVVLVVVLRSATAGF
ncbi:MAG: rhomboid family intramembrane serine protease [Jatrophihabitantaceae bacterium]